MFVERLKQALDKKGVSARKASLDMGLSEGAVKKYLGGTEPSLSVLVKMSDYFNESIGYLITGNPESMELKNMRLAIWAIAYIIQKEGKTPKNADSQVEAVMSVYAMIQELGVEEGLNEEQKLAKVIPIAQGLVRALAA